MARSLPFPARLGAVKRRPLLPLDVVSPAEAKVRRPPNEIRMFKGGKPLLPHPSPEAARRVHHRDGQVSAELTFHNIPRTAANARSDTARLRVALFNVHAADGPDMRHTTRTEVHGRCRTEGWRRPLILAVTAAPSVNASALGQTSVPVSPQKQAVHSAKLAQAAGLSGMETSSQETPCPPNKWRPRRRLIVPSGRQDWGDQKRGLLLQQAIGRGADYVGVGKPVQDAADPHLAARQIVSGLA